MMKVAVYKFPQDSPDDVSHLRACIDSGTILASTIVAILGKTEGNGCVNDFTRGFATQTLKTFLAEKIGKQAVERIVFVMSGGTEGVLSPHMTVFTREPHLGPPKWGLVVGTSHTRDFEPEEIGSIEMIRVVAEAVKLAMNDAGLVAENVHFVQIKCPLVTSMDDTPTKQRSSYKSMADSRGASALGVALALGELNESQLTPDSLCHTWSLCSGVASTSAGIELQNCEILVIGNAEHSSGEFVIGHNVMQHVLDRKAVEAAIAQTGQPLEHIVNVFAKAEADPSGLILKRRHTMLDDSDISHTRMARAVVGAVIASVVNDPMIYVSGGDEHQGPSGGGPIAVVSRCL